MSSRALRTVGASVTALALATALSGTAASAGSPSVTPGHAGAAAATSVAPAAKVCFTNDKAPADFGINSQNFETANDIYDAMGAVDVTPKRRCAVKQVTVTGFYYNGAGPADSETVTFYKDKKGKPGKVVSEQTVKGADAAGTFTIPVKKVKLKGKTTYWVSVQANMDLSPGGQWAWLTSAESVGKGDLYQNPGDGFGSGCTKWSNLFDCFDGAAGPDLIISLSK